MESLQKLKLLVGVQGSETDDLLELLLANARKEILRYTRRLEWSDELDGFDVRLAIEGYNRLGAEGAKSHSEGSVRRVFESDSELLSSLRSLRLARVVGGQHEIDE